MSDVEDEQDTAELPVRAHDWALTGRAFSTSPSAASRQGCDVVKVKIADVGSDPAPSRRFVIEGNAANPNETPADASD
jgi:hypothetical protein